MSKKPIKDHINILDWCIRDDDYQPATPPPHQQMKRRRKKTRDAHLSRPATGTHHHHDYPHQPLSSFNHPHQPYPVNLTDIDSKKSHLHQQQRYNNQNLNLCYLYGDSIAQYGHLREAFDIYAFIASNYTDGVMPLTRLKVLSSMLIDCVRKTLSPAAKATAATAAAAALAISLRRSAPTAVASTVRRLLVGDNLAMEGDFTFGGGATTATANANASCDRLQDRVRYSKNKRIQRHWKDGGGGGGRAGDCGGGSGDVGLCDDGHVRFCDVLLNDDCHSLPVEKTRSRASSPESDLDPLLCLLCKDILRCPVTANCGHSFCRACCEAAVMCPVCRVRFPTSFTPSAAAIASSEFPPAVATTADLMMASLYNSTSNTHSTSLYMDFSTVTAGARDNTNANALLHNRASGSSGSDTSTGAAGGGDATNNIDTSNSGSNGSSMKFMPDVLVRRLVEKWWGADLQAKTINERAASFVSLNLLDDALKFCNASLEKSPNNFNSLLLRAEVLRKLNHYQSSLADIDHALRKKPSSAKAHYHRSLALCGLGRFEEALLEQCLAVSLDDKNSTLSSTELFQHDLAKLLQKLLAQSPKKIHLSTSPASSDPYDIVLESQYQRRKQQIGLLNTTFNADDTITSDATTNSDLLRNGSRKHCRRKPYDTGSGSKSSKKSTKPPPPPPLSSAAQDNFFGSTRFDTILERTKQEVQKIREMELELSQEQPHLIPVNKNLIDATDFDCVLCCRTFWKPVVTPCGHTYCWVCLDRCMDYSPSCPLCMSPLVEQHVNVLQGSSSPVPFILAKRPVTKFLEAAMKRFIPECYEKRFRQEMDLEPSVPVFICTTAFPHVPCPLFVYEPRYRLMVRRAVESGEKQFGIVQSQSGKSRYYDVGTILDIRDCVLLGDGCSILSTIGCKRFRILARNEKDGYETAKVEYIYDEIITDDNVSFISSMHASVLSKAIEWYESLGTELKEEILRSFGEMPAVEDNWESIADGPAWAWWIIALLPLNQQLKVDILATTSLEKRLRAIEKTLDCMSGNLKRSQESCVVVHREGIQPCQTVECCQRSSSDLSSTSDSHPTSEHSQLML